MVTCQSSELGWEVTLKLPADFLSLGRGSVIFLDDQCQYNTYTYFIYNHLWFIDQIQI